MVEAAQSNAVHHIWFEPGRDTALPWRHQSSAVFDVLVDRWSPEQACLSLQLAELPPWRLAGGDASDCGAGPCLWSHWFRWCNYVALAAGTEHSASRQTTPADRMPVAKVSACVGQYSW